MPTTEIVDINNSPSDGSHPDCGSFVDADQFLGTSGTSKFSTVSVNSPPSFTEVREDQSPSTAKKAPSLPESIALLPGERLQTPLDPNDSILHGKVFFTNYRVMFILSNETGIAVIPNLAVESAELDRDEVITVTCRNGRIFRLSANLKSTNTHNSNAINKQLCEIVKEARSHHSIFAFQVPQTDSTPKWLRGDSTLGLSLEMLKKEFTRLDFTDYWHISNANMNFEISETYPEHFILPKGVDDRSLPSAATGRFLGRIPTAVWRDVKSGAVLLRGSQPVIPWIGPMNCDEVNLFDMSRRANGDNAEILVMDARSLTSANANRMKFGGYESPAVYTRSTPKFMNLPNIHSVRDSFAHYRQIIATRDQDLFFFQNIHNSSWLYQVYNIILSAKDCLETLVDHGKSVLVHCSDGWDRTTQIVSLAKLLGDGYYRTIEGFEVLVRSEWIGFGHKFNDRNCVFSRCSDQERSPIFLQWLDCVYQLCLSNPTAFEFNQNYLVKVAQHSYSGLFGTFLFNSIKEYKDCLQEAGCDSLPSLWAFLRHYIDRFQNVFYDYSQGRLKIPPMRNLKAWEAVYVPNRFEEPLNCANDGIVPNFSDLVHSSYIESFYIESSTRQTAINRSHSEENVSSSKSPSSTGPTSINFPIEIPNNSGKLKKCASQSNVQHDIISLASLDLKTSDPVDISSHLHAEESGSAPVASTSFSAIDSLKSHCTLDSTGASTATVSDGSDQSATTSASDGDQSDPEPSSSGSSSRNSVVHRSKKFRLRFGKEKVIDADGLTSIINIEVDSVNRMNSKNEKKISDLQAQIYELKRKLAESEGGKPLSHEEIATTASEDEYIFIDRPSLGKRDNTGLHDSSAPATLDAHALNAAAEQAELLHGHIEQQRLRAGQRQARLSTRSNDRNSEGYSEHAFHIDDLNVHEDMHSPAEHQPLVPLLSSAPALRRRQLSNSSNASFNGLYPHSGSNQSQTVRG